MSHSTTELHLYIEDLSLPLILVTTSFNPLYSDGFFHTYLIQLVWDCHFCTLRGHLYNFLNYDVFLSLKVVLILANSAEPNEMQHYAAFHLGLHYLPKYLFRDFQYMNR